MDPSLFIMQYAEEAGGGGFGSILIAVLGYVFFALALMGIAKKTNTKNAWFAWIPILNIVLLLNIAKRPVWWLILLLIPLVNIIIGIIVGIDILKARGKPAWWIILLLIPIVNVIVLCILAWGK
ncbi:MAG: hypothetical protein JW984_16330 [Deltaproteobacteria bacterium]|uniref:Signal peptidase I n=1 Tax=Candidatus Zymogenus saltonus TaxID=2844893 RepID=A0A9D8KHI8_9DELT|nr:hypothetical protein [Candidatus Zymogenus saltonus]